MLVRSSADAPPGFDKFNPFVWDTYFGLIERSASTTPWMFTTETTTWRRRTWSDGYGGHLARLDFPGNGPEGCPSVYLFTYGNVAVLSLDANDVSYEINANTGYPVAGKQLGAKNFGRAPERSEHRLHRCFFHHCTYSTVDSYASDGGVRDASGRTLRPLPSRPGSPGPQPRLRADRSHPGGKPTTPAPDNSTVYPETDGTVYYISRIGRSAALQVPARRTRVLPGP